MLRGCGCNFNVYAIRVLGFSVFNDMVSMSTAVKQGFVEIAGASIQEFVPR